MSEGGREGVRIRIFTERLYACSQVKVKNNCLTAVYGLNPSVRMIMSSMNKQK